MKELVELIPDGVSQADIAKACNVTQQAVSQWFVSGLIPAKRAQTVKAVTGIPLHKLNPQVYPTVENTNV
ncbi:Cro/CI family transcriptional regulator [Shewanella sp. MBTL60-007]|uniref:Cro/CI family transcriptional regulator n=1 Tax=Shewanella sp. MBTL60-007 TaxID=2815911 RepID=UPI001BC5E37C|nr:Cro/CI family transcriptional regulator [Shewanella sp. MBTL60-007]GIU22143.1 hypothetical protein TUM3792_23870 [Shewanella sp. MBTL60-007]